ncbi:unnamed protein product [Ixodes persulcatus]
MCTGKYCHFGFMEGLRLSLKNVSRIPDTLEFIVNVDGLPLTKSTTDQFWPILCCVRNCGKLDPFPVGVFYGQCKALDANIFLEPFVAELKEALEQGVLIEGKVVNVELSAIVCDAPAKSYILSIKGHTGYFSCTKCTVKGTYSNGRMSFPELEAPLRTDKDFRCSLQEGHHTGETILKELPIDLVKQVPLDYMHLVCLGVVKKILWFRGSKTYRLGNAVRDEMSRKCVELAQFVASDFSRKPRTFSDLDRWKATEFRMFVLYNGPLILAKCLPESMYKNVMVLHCGLAILASTSPSEDFLCYAERLLVFFVRTYISIYGESAVSHNVHGLIHLGQDVRTHGPLEMWSSFPFENFMQSMKKMK